MDAPAQFGLEQNFPDPFRPVTTIRFALPEPSPVEVEIYDALGRRVAMKEGWHDVTFDAGHLAGGIYFYRIRAGEFRAVRNMVLVK